MNISEIIKGQYPRKRKILSSPGKGSVPKSKIKKAVRMAMERRKNEDT